MYIERKCDTRYEIKNGSLIFDYWSNKQLRKILKHIHKYLEKHPGQAYKTEFILP